MKEDSISSSLEARQQDEFNSISSIYGDIFTDITPKGLVWNKKPSPHFQIFLQSSEHSDRPTISILLDFEFTPTYPLLPPKIKILQPKNILNAKVEQLKSKIDDLIKEFVEEEVCFVIISDLKDMLDEFQSTTEKVLSLEEERELRLKNERLELEKREAEREKQMKVEQQKQNAELNKQILKIRGEYYNSIGNSNGDDMSDGEETNGGYDLNEDDDVSLVPSAKYLAEWKKNDYFIFANTMVGQLPSRSSALMHRLKFKFKTVMGLVPTSKKDLLSPISKQFIVRPYFPHDTSQKINPTNEELSYLLSEISLTNPFWKTDEGKKHIQDLESELQSIVNINHENIASLVGFQIDETTNNSGSGGWHIRLLTEYSSTSELIKDLLSDKDDGNNRISWALARTWLIQLIPGFEHLQNCGVIHKLVCPLTISVWNEEQNSLYYDDDNENENVDDSVFDVESSVTAVLKISHASYGFRLLKMLKAHPNKELLSVDSGSFFEDLIPINWRAPELLGECSFSSSGHVMKTDIWDLSLLFMRVMLNYDVLNTKFKSPSEFYAKFNPLDYPGEEQYGDIVFDLFCKMLQVKPSKRPSPMELNAVKFLRDGPVLNEAVTRRNGDNNDDPYNFSTHQAGAAFVLTTGTIGNTTGNNGRRPSASYADISNTYNLRNLGRYERDFEEVGKLGKGGFGEVVKARNRIEGTFYAIKKIKHRAHKLDSLLSEVLSLSRLNHQYIVRYYGTWVEEIPEEKKESNPKVEEPDDGTENSLDESQSLEHSLDGEDEFLDLDLGLHSYFSRSTSFLGTHDNSFQVDFISNDPIIEFGYSTDEYEDEDDSEASTSDALTTTKSVSTSATQSRSMNQLTNSRLLQLQVKSILYIQMEFCENNTLQNLIEQGLPKNPHEYWRLLRQLLEAVSYIHREGFIHRDLKPMNIFIDKSNNVKVGDFGLAKNTSSAAQTSDLIVLKDNQIQQPKNKDWSTVVGTLFYTAKEISTGNYDEKVDMYALGIIFFEMCWSLGTGMERAHTLNGLRLSTIEFPKEWKPQLQKLERKIITKLLDHDPTKRPGATELLSSGLLPVEHQDQVIKEALKSLADPASPWQQQVRETLFKQPYVLARDLLFDDKRGGTGVGAHDYLLYDKMIDQLKRIFKRHGALEDFNNNTTNVLFPKLPFYSRENVYEVLDKSGSILQLPYDLTLPLARFLSKNNAPFVKVFKNAFVYRQPGPNKRPGSMPDKYSAVSFDLVTHDSNLKLTHDAECLHVVDEIIMILPLAKKTKKGSNTSDEAIILINHSDILNSIISFSFENVGIDERKRIEVIGILSQLGIETESEQIKKRLREDADVPYTVTKDLIDKFNFTLPIEQVKIKLKKAMMDSPHFARLEKALNYLTEILLIFKRLGGSTTILFNPLSNYNNKYYRGGVMFQAVLRVDRRKARIITGGRYDSLIESFGNKDIVKSMTPYAVGFQLSSTFMFLLLKKNLQHFGSGLTGWRKSRCDVLVTSLNPQYIRESGYDILRSLRMYDISSDIFMTDNNDTIEDILDQAQLDGVNWIVLVKNPQSTIQRRAKRNFKPLRIRDVSTNKDVDIEYEELTEYLRSEISERNTDESGIPQVNSRQKSIQIASSSSALSIDDNHHSAGETSGLAPLFSVDLSQKVTVVPNDAPRGRKNNNKRDKWETENDAKIASSSLMKSLANAPIISIDARDEVIKMILITSLEQKDEFIKKVTLSSSNFPRSYAVNIYNIMCKERSRGTRWVVLYSTKTQSTTIIDLDR